MKNADSAVTLGLLGALLLLGTACSRGGAAEISADALRERQVANPPPVVLDVRTREEFERGHIPGAVHIPYDELSGRLGEVPASNSESIVVYCMAGPRARRGEQTLQRNGFDRVLLLEGGFRAWEAAGHPIERSPSP